MALKICKDCKKEISSSAIICPHCGCPDPYNNMHNNMLKGLVICFIFFILCLGSCVMCINNIPETANENNVISDISTFIPNYTSYPRQRIWKVAQINIEVGKESYIAYFRNLSAMFLYVTENNKFGDPSIFKIYAINGLAMSLLKPAHGVRFSYYDVTKLDFLKAQEYLNKNNAIEISY